MPSPAGFQYFFKHSLNLDSIDEQDIYQVVKALILKPLLEDILQKAGQILADLTGYSSVFWMWSRPGRN